VLAKLNGRLGVNPWRAGITGESQILLADADSAISSGTHAGKRLTSCLIRIRDPKESTRIRVGIATCTERERLLSIRPVSWM